LKDLILISAYCNTERKKEILKGLVDDIQKVSDVFDIMIVSHTPIPEEISRKTDYCLYDSKNELLYEWDMRSKPWFSPGGGRPILSIFTGTSNTHLAVWRLIILGNSLAKNLGYNKVHHIEYDARISNFSELIKNSEILENKDSVTYLYQKNKTIDPILFGSYQAYRLDTLNPIFIDLNEDRIKQMIRDSNSKSPEGMMRSFLHDGKNFVEKSTNALFDGNQFMFSLDTEEGTAWCVPYYDKLTEKLCFVVWNMERTEVSIEVSLVYNGEKIRDIVVDPHHWFVFDLDDYKNAKELVVILNGKIRNSYSFEEYRDYFKEFSFRDL